MSYSQKMEQGYLSLVAGLDTESSPLNPREGTTSDELNMVLDTDGMIRRRRKGILEVDTLSFANFVRPDPGFVKSSGNPVIVGQYYWDDARKLITVLQSWYMMEYDSEDQEDPDFEVFSKFDIIFGNPNGTSSELDRYRFDLPFSFTNDVGEDFPNTKTYPQFAEIKDSLLILFGGKPMVFRENENGLDVYNLNISVRDFKFIDDGLQISQRPQTLEPKHKYNLYNAGWVGSGKDKLGEDVVYLTEFLDVLGVYPSNSDIVNIGIREDFSSNDRDKYFDPEEFERIPVINTEAPRGRFIYPIERINRLERQTSTGLADGSRGPFSGVLLEDGSDPGTGEPPPSGDPIYTPPPSCIPGEVCNEEP